jgi:tetratricopeptide (TPR) repeat protein
LNLAHLERKSDSKVAGAAAIYRLATGVMAISVFSIVSLGGYLLFEYVNTAPFGPAQTTDASRAEPTKAAALVTTLAETVDRTREEPDDVDDSKKSDNSKDITQSSASDAFASMASEISIPRNGRIPPAHDLGPRDANYCRERATAAYRNGDLYVALAYLNLAISYDPGSSDAYINRGIVFHRMGDLERAFADVAQAKRIDDSNRSKALPAARAP